MKTEIRTVSYYCFLRGLSVEDTYNEMIIAYGNKVPQPRTIKKWFERFEEKSKSIEDLPRTGRPKKRG